MDKVVYLDIIKVAIGVIIAVLGWIVAHYFNSLRDAAASRKELVTSYLVDVYRKLNNFACVLASGAEGSMSLATDINSAVGDVQLFGTKKQIELVQAIAKTIVAEDSVPTKELTELLFDLRNSLRSELHLDPVDEPIAHLNVSCSRQSN